jgi:release factor glutamine methyltransferase
VGGGGPDSVLDILRASTSFLEGRGVDSPRLDSELLMAQVLGLDRLQLYINFDRPVIGAERDALRELVKRRAAREPVALILGTKEFRSRAFHVPPGVLVPRPDTELLAELAIEALADAGDAPLVLDLGCGSGILAVSIAAETPAKVLAVDQAQAAIDATRHNAQIHGVAERVGVIRGSWTEGIPDRFAGQVALVVSNPPYVDEADYATLQPEITRYEPRDALVAPGGTLDAYRRIADGLDRWLAAGARVLVEVGMGQAAEVEAILAGAGLQALARHEDLASIERVVDGTWPA